MEVGSADSPIAVQALALVFSSPILSGKASTGNSLIFLAFALASQSLSVLPLVETLFLGSCK
jgi:hypothetical protein